MKRLLFLGLSVALGVYGCSKFDAEPKVTIQIQEIGEIVGSYSLEGTNPFGLNLLRYVGEVTVSMGEGSTVVVSETIAGQTWAGQGKIDSDGRLYVFFEEMDVEGTWAFLENGNLHGTWKPMDGDESGTEVWTPVR